MRTRHWIISVATIACWFSPVHVTQSIKQRDVLPKNCSPFIRSPGRWVYNIKNLPGNIQNNNLQAFLRLKPYIEWGSYILHTQLHALIFMWFCFSKYFLSIAFKYRIITYLNWKWNVLTECLIQRKNAPFLDQSCSFGSKAYTSVCATDKFWSLHCAFFWVNNM